MKRQYIRLFSFLIGLSFLISGVLFSLVNNYKIEKREKIKEEGIIADEIIDVYETFYSKEKDLNIFREELLDDIKEFSEYFANMPNGYKLIVPKLEEYEEKVTEIVDASYYLKQKCVKRYSVLVANDKCDAYYINLEKTINIFIGDMEIINSKINDYNDWIVEENKSDFVLEKYKELKTINMTKYNEYVDLNKDGTYLGKRNE